MLSKNKTSLVIHVCRTFVIHSVLSDDVTDTDSWTQNNDTNHRLFAIFKHEFLRNIGLMDQFYKLMNSNTAILDRLGWLVPCNVRL